MKTDVLIIGTGQAGAMTAITLRQKKYKGSITIIGEEEHLPYQRPPLSKNFLDGISPTKNLYLKSSAYYEKNQIDILLNNSVISINRADKNIDLKDGSKFYYKKLVIAVGSKLNTLDIHCDKEGIYYLRTINDSIKIRSLLDQQKKIVIIGAGYIGLEIASAACKKNHQVTILEADNRVMSRSVCPETSRFFQKIHEKEGVKFFFNTSVIDVEEYNLKKRIHCNDGTVIDVDAIVIGVGVQPNIDLAYNAGLACNNGIIVNDNGQTSDQNIFAAGDCTFHPNAIFQTKLRLESVHNAVEQAKSVAASICGNKRPYNQVPWFWSDQYDIKLQIAGISDNYDEYVVRGDINQEKFSTFYLKKKILIAVVAINDQHSYLTGKKLISLRTKIDRKILENMRIDLKELI